MTAVKQKSIEILNQLGSLISRLPKEAYFEPLACLQESSIGKHVRHIVEFFDCLLDGIPDGMVNYDLRKRSLRLETEPMHALERIALIQREIPEIREANFALQADFGNGNQDFPTSVSRELAFCMDHCVHHLALIRAGMLQHFPSIAVEEDFGVAFSTLRYLQQQNS